MLAFGAQKNYGYPSIYLNTALCQFTPAVSKTQSAIEYIKHFSLLSRVLKGEVENGIHHISLILTNNSLIETKMWRHRLDKKTENLNICTLSSKDGSTYNTIDQVISHLGKAKSANQLPDILVMCTHGARTENTIEFIDALENGNLNFSKKGIHQITLTIMFDEADKNITLISDFIKHFMTLIGTKNECILNHVVRDIHFITATPIADNFWKTLKKCGIEKLKNIKYLLKEIPDRINLTHDELLKDYRSISEHIHKSGISDMTLDPVKYTALVLPKIFQERKGPLTIFAPAELYVTTHFQMATLFNANNIVVLILNGEKKGFQYPDGGFHSIESFNIAEDIEGELYNTLIKWRAKFPTTDLAITGYLNVERGVTFNTQGFNFTDFIVSAYHLKNEASLVQLLGRANGGKEYVKVMNIWSPQQVIAKANELIQTLNNLHRKNPMVYKEKHFRKPTKKEIEERAMTVPTLISVTKEEYDTAIMKKGKKYDSEKLLNLIGNYNKPLEIELRTLERKQITQPENEKSIKKHITDFVNASHQNKKCSIDIDKDEKEKNIYQIFLDSKENRIIVSKYYGKKLTEEPESEDDNDDIEDA